jgi:hypothetical protein
VLAGVAYGASCDGIEDLNARLACFDRLADCAGITADAERLACFERRPPDATAQSTPTEAAQANAGNATPAEAAPARAGSAPTVIPSDEAHAARPPADDDPFPVKGRRRFEREEAPAETLTASIARVRRDPRGIVYLFLDNGQVWRETARSKFDYQAGMAVEISTGTLGSTNLVADGMAKHAKVRRVE